MNIMSKYEIKELFAMLVFSIINFAIAYFITTALGIQNVILYQSLTATQYIITYEIIIWFVLSLIGVTFYHYKYEI